MKLLERLSQTEEFRVWRDLVAGPVLGQLETALRDSDSLPEPLLRGSLKHYFSVKAMFYEVFEQVAAQNAAERERDPSA